MVGASAGMQYVREGNQPGDAAAEEGSDRVTSDIGAFGTKKLGTGYRSSVGFVESVHALSGRGWPLLRLLFFTAVYFAFVFCFDPLRYICVYL